MSRRNNMERIGASPNQNSPASQGTGFDFSFVSPTMFVELPSEGKYYPEAHPLHGQATIEIREMTAHEEDILADTNMQRSGVAINKMIQSLIVDKRINHESLLVGDKNAITIAARIGGYGSEYKTAVTCPSCGTKSEYEFELTDLKHKECDSMEQVIHSGGRIFQLNLPKTEYNVRIKLLNVHEVSKLNKSLEKARKGRSNTKLQTGFLKLILHSVENKADDLWYEDQPTLGKFIDSIPASDSAYIRSKYKLLAPDMDMSHEFECSECGYSQDLEVPLNAEFFWPNS